MANGESLQERILNELHKTGYPTEILSASTMARSGWGVVYNPSYRDDIEGISREFDILAYRQWSFDTSDAAIAVDAILIAECKKSEKPWVFFATPENLSLHRLGELVKGRGRIGSKRAFTGRDWVDSLISDDTLRAFHHYFQKPNLARTFHEPFKGHERADTSPMIYSAVLSAVKASLFHLQDRPSDNWLRIFYPIIILDGNLFEAHVAANKVIELVPADHILLSFNYTLPKRSSQRSIWEGQHRFLIDVVHERYLDQFLQIIEDEHAALVMHLQGALGERTGSA